MLPDQEGDLDLEVPQASEIIDGLFVGTAEAAIEATVGANSKQIRRILNVGGCVTPAIFVALAEALAEKDDEDGLLDAPNMSKTGHGEVFSQNGIVTLSMPMDDFGRTQLTETFLLRCFDFIESGLQEGPVLVHCRLGVNRSVTVAAAYLMHRYAWTADEALKLLRQQRSCAQPHEAYCKQLNQLHEAGTAENNDKGSFSSPKSSSS